MAVSNATSSAANGEKAAQVTPNDTEVNEPHENDVLCGRGGSINSWKGL
jgi:hypothetical protein